MARIRSVKPEYWTSEQVMNMSRDARLLFIGLWTFCDDNGIHPASALSLKAEVLPGDTLTADQVMVFIDEMIEQGLVEEYEAHGRAFWRVTGWRRHQRIDQPTFRHPTGDARSDTSDAGDTKGDRVTGVTYKRLGGKQRQIVLRKLRERDGDACHLCCDTSNLSILSLAPNGEESASDINSLRLICAACKRNRKRGDAKKIDGDTQGDTQALVGDSPTERSREESRGKELEGKKNHLRSSSSQASTEVGAGQQQDDDDQPQRSKRATAIATLLREVGIEATSGDAIVLAWATDPRVTKDLLTLAIERARKFKPGEVIGLVYLDKAVQTVLQKQSAPAAAVAASVPPIPPRRPQGNEPKGPDETYDEWQARVDAYERTRRNGGKAA